MSDIQIVQEFAWSGRFSPAQLFTVGAVAGAITLILTWWGLRSCRRLFPVSAALRLGALAVVLWMLAEPVAQTTITRRSSKAVVVLADASASMGVVDRPSVVHEAANTAAAATIELTQQVRWAAVASPDGLGGPMFHIDGSRYALTVSRDRLEQSARAASAGGDLPSSRQLATEGLSWLREAKRQLDLLPDQAVIETKSRLDGFLIPKFDEWLDDIGSGTGVLLPGRRAGAMTRSPAVPSDVPAGEDLDGAHAELQRNLDQAIDDLDRAAERLAGPWRGRGDGSINTALHRSAASSRREKIAGILDHLEGGAFKKLALQGEILRHAFDGDVFPWPKEQWAGLVSLEQIETQQATDLAAALEQVERAGAGRTIEAVFLLTDGGHNASGDPLQKASSPDVPPIYIVPVGAVTPARDVALHHIQGPRRVMQNDLIRIEAMLDAYACAGESLVVQLLRTGEVVDEQTLVVPSETYLAPLRFEHKAEEIGVQHFELRVEPLPEERVVENNQAKLSVEVTESRVRLLLADGLPRWEFRYLRNLFKRDERVEFDSVLIDPPELQGESAAFPQRLEAWGRYGAVILGDLPPDILTPAQQQHLNDYVGVRGGTLILIAGERAMPEAYLGGPLGPMLPVEPIRLAVGDPQGYRLVVTSEGRSVEVVQVGDVEESERVWSRLPPTQDVSPYSLPRPTSHVWIAAMPQGDGSLPHGNRPARHAEANSPLANASRPPADPEPAFLCWHRFGKGRVVYLSAAATYRLRFRQGDRYHHRFWGQLLRWAMARDIGTGSRAVRLVTDKMRYQAGDPVQVSVRLARPNDEAVTGAGFAIEARQGTESIASVPLSEDPEVPGHYRATWRGAPVGHIRLVPAGPAVEALLAEEGWEERVEAEINVEPPLSLELRDTRCNLSLLHRIAEASGGAVVPPTALPTILAGLDLAPDVLEEVSRQPLWPRWYYLLVFVGIVSAEWLMRKLIGLV